jgi:hypothetical protein
MSILVVRPTRKRILASYLVCLVLWGLWIWFYYSWLPDKPPLLMGLGAIALLAPLWADLKNRLVTLRLDNGKLSYSSGFKKISTRVLDTAKVRDVHIEQTFLDRMFGIGSIAVDAIGESGKIIMTDIDRPRQVADAILDSCREFLPRGNPIIEDSPPQ